eukprot:scaffold100612_cov35-Tisochrysis_lutea.AAC.1
MWESKSGSVIRFRHGYARGAFSASCSPARRTRCLFCGESVGSALEKRVKRRRAAGAPGLCLSLCGRSESSPLHGQLGCAQLGSGGCSPSGERVSSSSRVPSSMQRAA